MESNHGMSLRTVIEYFDNFVSVIGFVLNSLLIYLIIYKTGTRLKDYRPILLQNCLIDTFFTIVNMMTKTQSDQKNGNFYIYMIGPLANIDAPYNNLIICFWVFAFYFCVTGVPVQFVYRYIIIVKGIKVTLHHYFVLLFSAFISALTYTLLTVYTFWPDKVSWEKAAALLRADHNYDEGIPSFVVASIDEWSLRVLFGYAYFLVTCVYVITVFSNLKIWRHLKAMENQMSAQAKDAQRQITVTLILQAVIPCVVSLIPILTAVTMTVFHANVPGVSLVVALLYTVIPVANSLLTLIVIRNYRKNLVLMLRRICGMKNHRIEPTTSSKVPPMIPATIEGIASKGCLEQLT